MTIYNFSAGPSVLPDEVKKQAQQDFLDYNGSGISVTEMSHRSKVYDDLHNEAISLLRELMNIGDDYEVMFIQGGASQQFAMVPLNFSEKKRADYVLTGNWSNKAFEEASRYIDAVAAASSKDAKYTYIPDVDTLSFRDNLDYVHITQNNTIFGTRYTKLPKADCPIISDASSNILSEVIDVNKYGAIYAGAQKNIGPAGLTIAIVRKDLLARTPLEFCPTMLKYSTFANNNSLYNTPPCFAIYMAMLTFRWLKKLGGVSEMQKINEYKAGLLYDYLDSSDMFKNPVNKKDRSLMNVPFITSSEELNKKFLDQATANGFISLKGHKILGGMRASIYNAMPVEGVKALIEFMKKFEMENK
ncbi:MAG TPA: 3-phosphoserine/phosphohydroxythreonine transaminase [Clostridia bacterium]|jgi:phosphoserine aminotransferase|nr:3-phosphoserine/phosphohydroxythreonine transaminase [Clostridia bacterium]